jgi:hypothetical protein
LNYHCKYVITMAIIYWSNVTDDIRVICTIHWINAKISVVGWSKSALSITSIIRSCSSVDIPFSCTSDDVSEWKEAMTTFAGSQVS